MIHVGTGNRSTNVVGSISSTPYMEVILRGHYVYMIICVHTNTKTENIDDKHKQRHHLDSNVQKESSNG